MSNQPTRIKCSARFKVVITKLMQLNDIEFELAPQDDTTIDDSLVKERLNEMWGQDEIDPMNGLECGEEIDNWESEIDEIVSFEIIKPKKFVDPDQVDVF